MIQLNLLPDVKLEYLKAQRTRRIAIALSFIVTSAAVVILILSLAVEGYQKHTLSNINKDISNQTSTLQHEPNIDSVLTVQSQLASLNSLHSNKPAATRLFPYLDELTPTPVTISNLTVDFNAHTVSITGSADQLASVNQFVDTLKDVSYTVGKSDQTLPAFSSILLSNFSLDSSSTPPATYTITANYDQTLFNITKDVSLNVPSQLSISSQIERTGPDQLFAQQPAGSKGTSSTQGSGQ